jgi:preprotein translocase subunit SecF
MAGTNLTFSKVVATPTTNAWSQAYSAGSLFAAISLQNDIIPGADDNLGVLGKDVISTLESEFFPLENKDLESIKGAINTTISKINEDIKLSFVVCYLHENILYLYAAGGGKAILKRNEKIGTVIDSENDREVKSASGYVQDKDFIILETEPFIRTVASPTLASALDKDTPEEVSEELAPHVHEKSEGGASAVILNYKEGVVGTVADIAQMAGVATTQEQEETEENENIIDDVQNLDEETDEIIENENLESSEIVKEPEEINEAPNLTQHMDEKIETQFPEDNLKESPETVSPYLTDQKSRRKMPKFGFGKIKGLMRNRRFVFLFTAIIILLIVIAGVFLFVNNGGSEGQKFDQVYNSAKAKFEEGQSLQDLNSELAQEKFKEAQQILVENQNTFETGSKEDNQIEGLLNEVNDALGGSSTDTSTSTATEVEKSESQILSVQIDNPDSGYFTQNEDFVYYITSKGVTRLDKGNSEEEAIITESWKEAGGIGVFGSNVYVLDKTDNILKFVPSGDEFTSSDYITETVDLAKSTAMTIDGSVYVLDSEGSIKKYTKGVEDDFSISGLEKPMSSPTRITTNEDFENIYILDKGNSRIVVIDKDGKFVKAYSADILKNARDIDPQETENAIFILSSDKVYKIETN